MNDDDLIANRFDLADDEMRKLLLPTIPDLPYIFISAVAQEGLLQLKDMIWNEINR